MPNGHKPGSEHSTGTAAFTHAVTNVPQNAADTAVSAIQPAADSQPTVYERATRCLFGAIMSAISVSATAGWGARTDPVVLPASERVDVAELCEREAGRGGADGRDEAAVHDRHGSARGKHYAEADISA